LNNIADEIKEPSNLDSVNIDLQTVDIDDNLDNENKTLNFIPIENEEEKDK